MADRGEVLIAAMSGRALAASARRGGYAPLVADFFGDQDTLAVADAHIRLAGNLRDGIDENALLDALEQLGQRRQPVGFVYGTGFEDRTPLLQRVAQHWQVLGNSAETVAKVKDPDTLASLCASLGIAFPEVSWSRPSSSAGWLAKRKGGAGGSHIKSVDRSAGGPGETYYQREVSGTPISALFLADGKRVSVLGYSMQWALPKPDQPYRYGGAVQPATLVSGVADALAAVVQKLGPALALVGLNSADFLVEGKDYWLIEINPRPGATTDIFERPEEPLFARHVAACRGRLIETPDQSESAKAAAIVYAEHNVAAVPPLDWPDWTADRPLRGSTIKAGEPLCTVYACSSAAAGARALAEQRRQMVLAWMGGRKQ
jgi:predicted ATP-grasp superfamily ATP-dependent carboligase